MAEDTFLEAGAIIDTSQIVPGLQSMASETQAAASQMTASFEQIGTASQEAAAKMEFSATEARHAFHGLGEEVGIRIPRFVQSFVAHLGGVGPALAAAFAPVAIIGLAEVLVEAGKKLFEFYEDVVNLKSEMEALDSIERHLIDTQIELSNALLKGSEELAGLTEGPVSQAKLHFENLKNEIFDLNKLVDQSGKPFKDMGENVQAAMREFLRPTLASDLASQLENVRDEIARVNRIMLNTEQGTKEYKALEEQLRALTSFYDALSLMAEKYSQQGQIAAAEITKAEEREREKQKRLAEEVERKQIELWNQQVEELNKRIAAELNEEERAAREKIRIMEESARQNAEFNKSVDEEIKKADEEKNRAISEGIARAGREQAKAIAEQDRLAKQAEKPWLQFGRAIAQSFDTMVRGILLGTQSIGQSLARLAGNMLVVMTEALAKILLKHAAHWLAVHILEQFGWTKQIGIAIAGATAKKAVQATADASAITSDAGVAGAAAFASVMAALPFPLNVATAPGVMAESIATTLGNRGFVAARQGMLLDEDRLIAAGAGEAVLPRDLTRGLQGIIRSGGGGTAGEPSVGGHTFNLNFGPVTALDARGVDAVLRSRAETIVSIFRQQKREFRL